MDKNNETFLTKLLHKLLQIHLSDGRVIIGNFICTDRDMNIILGHCQEYTTLPGKDCKEQPRMLGLAMIPGQHVKNIELSVDKK